MSGIENYVSATMKRRILAGATPAWMLRHIRGRYIIKSTLSAPLWVHRRDFKHLREEANKLTLYTGVRHVLDHHVPIDHPYVCGLTAPWNIRVIPYDANAYKRNSWHPDQEEFHLPPPVPYQRMLI